MKAFAKINLALVVGPLRADGKHEVVTVLQAIDLHDDIRLDPSASLMVEGFVGDTLVRAALEALADATGVAPTWRVRIEKRIPVAAGLGGGSSDAAAALRMANELLPDPLSPDRLHGVAARVGADVPFFLQDYPCLGTGPGTDLEPLELPLEYAVLLVLPDRQRKESSAAVYRRFDERSGADGFGERRAALLEALAGRRGLSELARLPRNDLATSPLAAELERLGAFRADVTGAGPVVYGLFERRQDAEAAASAVRQAQWTWLARPVHGR